MEGSEGGGLGEGGSGGADGGADGLLPRNASRTLSPILRLRLLAVSTCVLSGASHLLLMMSIAWGGSDRLVVSDAAVRVYEEEKC